MKNATFKFQEKNKMINFRNYKKNYERRLNKMYIIKCIKMYNYKIYTIKSYYKQN